MKMHCCFFSTFFKYPWLKAKKNILSSNRKETTCQNLLIYTPFSRFLFLDFLSFISHFHIERRFNLTHENQCISLSSKGQIHSFSDLWTMFVLIYILLLLTPSFLSLDGRSIRHSDQIMPLLFSSMMAEDGNTSSPSLNGQNRLLLIIEQIIK